MTLPARPLGSRPAAAGDSTGTTVTVLDGSTFVVCDRRGDLDGLAATSGFFAADTRFLSRSVLTIDGERAESVSLEQAAPHLALFELRGPRGLALRRELFVGHGLEETITVENRPSSRWRRCSPSSSLATSPTSSRSSAWRTSARLAVPKSHRRGPSGGRMRRRSSSPTTDSRRARWSTSRRLRTSLTVAVLATGCGSSRGASWQLLVAVEWLLNGAAALGGPAFEQQLRDDRRERDASLEAWWSSVPVLQGGEATLERTWSRSLADLAALRLHWTTEGMVPAAGLPWFMTVFGRDTLITSFQELVLGPDPAAATLRALAETQAETDDPERDAEPGKIVHARSAAARRRGSGPTATTAPSIQPRCFSSCSRSCGAGVATTRSSTSWRALRAVRSPGSTTTATATATASSNTSAGLRTGSTTRTGRTRTTRWSSTTARSRALRSLPSRCRGTSTTRSCASPSLRGACGATMTWRRSSSARQRSCASASTRRSGSRSAAGMRSVSTRRSGRSTRSPRTWGICSGVGSSRRSGSPPLRSGSHPVPLVRLGRTDAGRRRGCVRPARVSQRHGLAP